MDGWLPVLTQRQPIVWRSIHEFIHFSFVLVSPNDSFLIW